MPGTKKPRQSASMTMSNMGCSFSRPVSVRGKTVSINGGGIAPQQPRPSVSVPVRCHFRCMIPRRLHVKFYRNSIKTRFAETPEHERSNSQFNLVAKEIAILHVASLFVETRAYEIPISQPSIPSRFQMTAWPFWQRGQNLWLP